MHLATPGEALQHSYTIQLIIECCRYSRFQEIQNRVIGFRLYVSNSEEAARTDLKVVAKKGQQAPTQKAFNMLADALVLAEGIEDCCKCIFQPLDQFIERDDDKNITFSPHPKAKACEPHKSPAVLREAWLRLQVLVLRDPLFSFGVCTGGCYLRSRLVDSLQQQ